MNIRIVDLNNFARYPSLAIGYLVSSLRDAGNDVSVFAPLSYGVQGTPREPQAGRFGRLYDLLKYRTAVSRSRWVRRLRERVAQKQRSQLLRETAHIAGLFEEQLDRARPELVLVSTYLMYHELCVDMARACSQRGVPLLLGGPYFAAPDVVREWIDIEGVTAIAGGELERALPELCRALIDGEDLDHFPGVFANGDRVFAPSPPEQELDSLPVPDFSDFPWERYPNRLIPVITGRGCGWGACSFCSDVTSTAGRTFRSRSVGNVLDELRAQSDRYQSRQFVFTDLKLNSDPEMWNGLVDGVQDATPGAHWIGAVHFGEGKGQELDVGQLRAARGAGMVRLTTGLESGSQRVLDRMRKGIDLAQVGDKLQAAHAAGISVRLTLILGYPGEEAEDVAATARFLREHRESIDRVMLNRFQIMVGTSFHRRGIADGWPQGVRVDQHQNRQANVPHLYEGAGEPNYRRSVRGLFAAVHDINRRSIGVAANGFEGVM